MDLYDDDVVNFHTANGVTSTSKMTSIQFGVFNDPVQAHVLDDTPSVLSMGKRCLDQGYTFIWPAARDPFMVDQDGMVKDHISYISIDQQKEHGNSSKIVRLLEVLDDKCSTSEGEGTIILDGESGEEMVEKNNTVPKTKKLTKKKNKGRRRKKKSIVCDVAAGSDIEEPFEEVDDDSDDEAETQYEPSVAEAVIT